MTLSWSALMGLGVGRWELTGAFFSTLLELGPRPISRESTVTRLDVDVEAAGEAGGRKRTLEPLREGLPGCVRAKNRIGGELSARLNGAIECRPTRVSQHEGIASRRRGHRSVDRCGRPGVAARCFDRSLNDLVGAGNLIRGGSRLRRWRRCRAGRGRPASAADGAGHH